MFLGGQLPMGQSRMAIKKCFNVKRIWPPAQKICVCMLSKFGHEVRLMPSEHMLDQPKKVLAPGNFCKALFSYSPKNGAKEIQRVWFFTASSKYPLVIQRSYWKWPFISWIFPLKMVDLSIATVKSPEGTILVSHRQGQFLVAIFDLQLAGKMPSSGSLNRKIDGETPLKSLVKKSTRISKTH